MKKEYFAYFRNLILPGVVFSAILGVIVGTLIFFYRYGAEWIFHQTHIVYDFVAENLMYLPLFFAGLIVLAYGVSVMIKAVPSIRGGGIASSEGVIRGLLSFHWWKTVIFTVISSFISFFVGLPLGSEGPSVQIGTAVGSGSDLILKKKDKAWHRYLMTGSAAAAFAVVTAAPIAGILFALEEVHKKFSPMLLLVSVASVLSSTFTAYALSIATGFEYRLFAQMTFPTLSMSGYGLFLLLGIIVSLLAYVFNRLFFYNGMLFSKKLKNVPLFLKLLIGFVLVGIIGLLCRDSLGGGHSVILGILEQRYMMSSLFLILGMKLILIPFVSETGATGGTFIPILLMGALVGGIFASIGTQNSHYALFVIAGMGTFIAASMGCPLVAMVFSIEAFGLGENVLPVLLAIGIGYFVSLLFHKKPLMEVILEENLKKTYEGRPFKVVEMYFEVKEKSFAIGKQARDLLLATNLLIISVQRAEASVAKMDNAGDKILKINDVIHLRCQTYDLTQTYDELEGFFGIQSQRQMVVLQEAIF